MWGFSIATFDHRMVITIVLYDNTKIWVLKNDNLLALTAIFSNWILHLLLIYGPSPTTELILNRLWNLSRGFVTLRGHHLLNFLVKTISILWCTKRIYMQIRILTTIFSWLICGQVFPWRPSTGEAIRARRALSMGSGMTGEPSVPGQSP